MTDELDRLQAALETVARLEKKLANSETRVRELASQLLQLKESQEGRLRDAQRIEELNECLAAARSELDQRVGELNRAKERYMREGAQRERSFGIVPLILFCPQCGERHVDEGDFAIVGIGELGESLSSRPHDVHECGACGFRWAPSNRHTVGVRKLP